MEMLDITLFETSLKATWFRKLLCQQETPWNQLFQKSFEKDLEKFTKLGSEFILKVNRGILNRFWINVFESSYDILKHQPLHNNEQILTTPL